MNIHPFVFNPLQENTYLIWDENSLKAAVIDPGMNDRMEEQLTHTHSDSSVCVR